MLLKDMDVYSNLQWKTKSNLKVDKLRIFQDIEFENLLDDFLYRVIDCQNRLIELELIITKILKETDYE